MSAKKPRILILYADAGFGHRSAALAIDAAFHELYPGKCETNLINPFDDERAPSYLRDLQSDYDRILTVAPDLYKAGYEFSDAGFPVTLVDGILILMLYDVMDSLVEKYHPDIVVATYPLFQAALDAVFTIKRKSIPIVTVITDLVSVHRIWFNPGIDLCLSSTAQVAENARQAGLPDSKLLVTGIPIHPEITRRTESRQSILRTLGLEPDRFTLLITGSKRLSGMPEGLHGLNHSNLPIQFILVAGGDEALMTVYQATEWHVPVKVFDYVDFMPRLMHASDVIVCKAGGLIVSEAMACGLPMLLTNILPGQEAGNADYVVQAGAGEIVNDSGQLQETIFHWIKDNRKEYLIHQRAAIEAGHPQAASDAAQAIWELVNKKPEERTVTHLVERTHLIQTLRKFRRTLLKELSSLKY